VAKQKRDQQAADAAVAIEKGVNRFELKVSERRFHPDADLALILAEGEADGDLVGNLAELAFAGRVAAAGVTAHLRL
jgi:hypothetical protein